MARWDASHRRFGRIATALKRKGRPIPTNDVWVDAHAMEYGADLVSLGRHSKHVDGLPESTRQPDSTPTPNPILLELVMQRRPTYSQLPGRF